ncbi:MAG TPA: RES domain-containing protein [Alcaligenes phenolicus]|uniref:RES domain-containing protein n=1 Tax=Alcaligenes phenolicus TaxID=232846 RepID=UPI002C860202|nr:RES domain-containing protein [Alcaligenes phenolicus]HRO22580.1 RES domain-containing protein [Alcaligenes phenolicus]
MIGSVEATIATALNGIRQKDWTSLVLSSASDGRWRELIWWHNKYYRVNGSNDGRRIQVPRKGAPEIPYERELFYPSPHSRFSLGAEANVAYFSNDFAINCCETIEQFSENPELSLEDFLQYGGGNPTPGWHGYPLNFHLALHAVVLDLSSNRSLFFSFVSADAGEAIWNVVANRDESKRHTQQLAIAAAAAGFDGIVYSSVRAPVDAVMPDTNLVVFNKTAIESGAPPTHEGI